MKTIILLAIVLLTSGVNASGYLIPYGQGVTINKIHAHASGGLTLWVNSNELQNPDECSRRDKVHIRSSLGGYDAMVTVIMSAYTANKKIGLWSTGCSTIPFWGGTQTFPIVSDVWITD